MFQIPLCNLDTTLNYALYRWQRSRSFEKKISFLTDLEKKYSIREILIVLLQFSQTTMIGYN